MQPLRLERNPEDSLEGNLIARLDEAVDRLLYLSEVSRCLSAALSDRECFGRLLELVVPKLADLATLNVVDGKGEIRRVAARAVDGEKRQILDSFVGSFPPHMTDRLGPGYIIRRGQAEMTSDARRNGFYTIFLEEYVKELRHPEWLPKLLALDVASRIVVPLKAHDQVLGALWLATSESKRQFSETDLKLAEEIATRAAFTVFQLNRYNEATQEIRRFQVEAELREQYLSQTRHDVLSVLTSARLSAQMIARTGKVEDKNRYARRIDDAISRVVEIIRAVPKAEPREPQAG